MFSAALLNSLHSTVCADAGETWAELAAKLLWDLEPRREVCKEEKIKAKEENKSHLISVTK